jgi:hypothetical protein
VHRLGQPLDGVADLLDGETARRVTVDVEFSACAYPRAGLTRR